MLCCSIHNHTRAYGVDLPWRDMVLSTAHTLSLIYTYWHLGTEKSYGSLATS